MNNVLSRIKNIKKWRWLLLIAFIIGLSFDSYEVLSYDGICPTFYEVILKQINDVSSLSLYFIFLLIIFDFGFENPLHARSSKPWHILHDIIGIYVIITIYLLLITIVSIFTVLIKTNNIDFSNQWATASNSIPAMEVGSLTPLSATLISLLFIFFRFAFITITLYSINRNCKKRPWGYLSGLTVCLMDAVAYYSFNVTKPTGIFPFEHSFLGSALKLTSSLTLNMTINISYWISLSIILLLFFKLSRKRINITT